MFPTAKYSNQKYVGKYLKWFFSVMGSSNSDLYYFPIFIK